MAKTSARILAERAACRDGGEQMQDAVRAMLVDAEHDAFHEGQRHTQDVLLALIEKLDELAPIEVPTHEQPF